jgi:hypothetical protein
VSSFNQSRSQFNAKNERYRKEQEPCLRRNNAEETLFIDEERVRHLDLLVDHVRFTYPEMESCVRLD